MDVKSRTSILKYHQRCAIICHKLCPIEMKIYYDSMVHKCTMGLCIAQINYKLFEEIRIKF